MLREESENFKKELKKEKQHDSGGFLNIILFFITTAVTLLMGTFLLNAFSSSMTALPTMQNQINQIKVIDIASVFPMVLIVGLAMGIIGAVTGFMFGDE